jgi:hypothetical protein
MFLEISVKPDISQPKQLDNPVTTGVRKRTEDSLDTDSLCVVWRKFSTLSNQPSDVL